MAEDSGFFEQLALVYTGGFRGSAARVRNPGQAVFADINRVKSESRGPFDNWWFKGHGQSFRCFFWGDLDFSGMSILSAMRRVFGDVQAWKPGYEAMLMHLERGEGHSLVSAGKQQQKDPITTGCKYADQILLPTMREKRQFLDQEVVDVLALNPIF